MGADSAKSLLMPAAAAARRLGIGYQSLVHAAAGTLCLNEYRRKQGRSLFYLAAQVEAHGAAILLYGECAGRCRGAAEAEIARARERINRRPALVA